MSKKQVLKEIEDVTEAVQALENQAQGVVIPVNVVESLLVLHDTSNRVGLTAVCEEIRAMAQEQAPEKFKR